MSTPSGPGTTLPSRTDRTTVAVFREMDIVDENTGTIAAATVDYTDLTADLVCAYVSHNPVPASEVATLIETLHAALADLGVGGAAEAVERPTPARIRKSIGYAALISFEDGKPYKTLGRHLRKLGLDPDAYRAKWGLPRDYPMVAAGYSELRSALAKSAGLGHPRRKVAEPAAPVAQPGERGSGAEKPNRAGRPQKVKGAVASSAEA